MEQILGSDNGPGDKITIINTGNNEYFIILSNLFHLLMKICHIHVHNITYMSIAYI